MEEKKKKKDKNKMEPKQEGQGGFCESPELESHRCLEDTEKEIEELKKKLEEKGKEAKDHYDRFLRMAADYENYKKRMTREKEEWTKFANEELIKAFLPFIDNLERAVNHSESAGGDQSLVEGVKLTLQQLLQALNKFGVTPIESIGKPFDPTFHEAMLLVETDQHEPNQVVEEFQRGYLLSNRLLRPATVAVAKPYEKEAQTE